jgi:hypothetical protein
MMHTYRRIGTVNVYIDNELLRRWRSFDSSGRRHTIDGYLVVRGAIENSLFRICFFEEIMKSLLFRH